MRRFLVFALLAALPAPVLLSPAPASAAVATYSYQITGGSSSGSLSIGTVTGGSFAIQYPGLPCTICSAVYLLSANVTGTAGTFGLTPVQISTLGPALVAVNNLSFGRYALFFPPQSYGVIRFRDEQPGISVTNSTTLQNFFQFYRGLNHPDGSGFIIVSFHEVAVPERPLAPCW